MTTPMATKHRVTNLTSQFQVLQEQASHYKHLKTQTSHLRTMLKSNNSSLNKSMAVSQQGEIPPLGNKIQKERNREINSQNKRLMMKLFDIIHNKSDLNNSISNEKSRPLRSNSELNKAKEEKKINNENLVLLNRLREVRPCVGNATSWKEHSQNYKKTLKRLQNFDSHNHPKAVLTLKSKYVTPTVQSYVEENYLANEKNVGLGLNFPMKFVWNRQDYQKGSARAGRSEERKKNSNSLLIDTMAQCGEEERPNSTNFKRKNKISDSNERALKKDLNSVVQKIDYSKGYDDIPERLSSENGELNRDAGFQKGNGKIADNKNSQKAKGARKLRPKSEIKTAGTKTSGGTDDTISFNNLEIVEDRRNFYKINADLIDSIFRDQDEDYNPSVVKMLEQSYLNQEN